MGFTRVEEFEKGSKAIVSGLEKKTTYTYKVYQHGDEKSESYLSVNDSEKIVVQHTDTKEKSSYTGSVESTVDGKIVFSFSPKDNKPVRLSGLAVARSACIKFSKDIWQTHTCSMSEQNLATFSKSSQLNQRVAVVAGKENISVYLQGVRVAFLSGFKSGVGAIDGGKLPKTILVSMLNLEDVRWSWQTSKIRMVSPLW